MFGLFQRRSEVNKLHINHKSFIEGWHKFSSIYSIESHNAHTEADAILIRIENHKK